MGALRSKKVQIPIFLVVGAVVAYDLFYLLGDESSGSPAPEPEAWVEAEVEPDVDREAADPSRVTEIRPPTRERHAGRDPFFFRDEIENGKSITLLLREQAAQERERRATTERLQREDEERDVLADRLAAAELRGVVVAPNGRSRAWIDGRILAEGDTLFSPQIVLASIRRDGALFEIGGRVFAKELAPPPPEMEEARDDEASNSTPDSGTDLVRIDRGGDDADSDLVPAIDADEGADAPDEATPGDAGEPS